VIIVDKALEARQKAGDPIRVGMVGAGFMGRGIALQILNHVPGMSLVAISNRSLAGASRAYAQAGQSRVVAVESLARLEWAIEAGRYVVTEDAMLLCQAHNIDAIIEVTGTVEFGAQVVLEAFKHGKHVVVMNAELDGTVGPILKRYADKAGVVFTADGTKVSFEQAIVANATGMRVARRGMFGPAVPAGTPIKEAVNWYPLDALVSGDGIVDYVVGAEPGPGVFVLGTHDHPTQKHYLDLYKLGSGPLYCFYTPYHLCHFEAPTTVARAVLFRDAAITPLAGPRVDVVATAKIDLKAGQVLDGMGYYMTYGQAENADVVGRERLLPMGLAEGCRLRRDLPKDQVLTYKDVELPGGRLCDRLRAEQDAFFGQTFSKQAEPTLTRAEVK
jgi:predicted homoserine dehydrogenase-like protein